MSKEELFRAVESFFSDISCTQEENREVLEELLEDIQIKIESLD